QDRWLPRAATLPARAGRYLIDDARPAVLPERYCHGRAGPRLDQVTEPQDAYLDRRHSGVLLLIHLPQVLPTAPCRQRGPRGLRWSSRIPAATWANSCGGGHRQI